tara:strand:+ start:551 stop:1018 length:468 start_codon:yes stop_codon:yes gene_type:complete
MTNIPAKLVAEFATISNRIEEAIRQDERHKLLQQLAKEGGEHLKEQIRQEQYQKHLTAIADIFADRNGETSSLNLGASAAKKLRQRRGFHATSKLGKLYRCLASRTYAVTKNTLARESGMTNKSVYQGISTLRGKGYKIESVFGKGSKARYKLAS